MLIKCDGIETDDYIVPPFELHEGQLLVLYLNGGEHYFRTAGFLKDIFCGKVQHEKVAINKKFTFVEDLTESGFRRNFLPTTVGYFLKTNAILSSPHASAIYQNELIIPKTKIKTLDRTTSKQLSLYTALSKTNCITFDLSGLGPIGAEETCKIVRELIKPTGAAILLDNFDDMKDNCSLFIQLQWKETKRK